MKISWHLDLHLHDRLEQHWLCGEKCLAKTSSGADLKSHVGRIDVVIRTIGERSLHAHNRKACNRSLGEGCTKAFFDRRDIFLGHATTDDGILKNKCFRRIVRQWLQRTADVGKLTRAARLLLVFVFVFRGPSRCLSVAYLWCTNLNFHFKFPFDALDVYIQMQLSHAGNERFAGFFVGGNAKGRILARESLQGLAQPVEAVAVGRYDRHLDNWLRHKHIFQRAIFMLRGVGVAAGSINAHGGHDITSFSRVDFLALVGVHLYNATESLLLAGALIDVGLAL